MTKVSVRRFYVAVLIVLLAFALRLHAIDRQDIWGDEAFSIWLSSQPLPEVVAGGADTHPPLYPFLLYAWLRAAGSSPLAVRFLSALIGTLTVPLVFVLGLRAFGQATGLLASLLTAVSPVLVYYSQETRMYGLVAVLGVASVYGAASILLGERRTTGWLAYFFATLAAAGAVELDPDFLTPRLFMLGGPLWLTIALLVIASATACGKGGTVPQPHFTPELFRFLRQLERLTTSIDAGPIDSFVIEGSRLVTLTQALPDGYYVVLVVNRSGSRAHALHRLRRAARVFEKEIF